MRSYQGLIFNSGIATEDTIPTTQNNALQMSLFSGPKTIRVSAHLSYDYKTVIDGSVVPEDDN